MAESQAKKDWTKANTTFIGLKLNHNTDSDILDALQGKQKQTEIKRLLRLALRLILIPAFLPFLASHLVLLGWSGIDFSSLSWYGH